MCCRRTSRFGHLCSQCSSFCGSSLHSGHVGSPGDLVGALLEVAMQSDIQEKFSSTMTVLGLLDGGSVTVRRIRAFAVANEMGRGGVSVAVAVAFANSSAASLPGMPL